MSAAMGFAAVSRAHDLYMVRVEALGTPYDPLQHADS